MGKRACTVALAAALGCALSGMSAAARPATGSTTLQASGAQYSSTNVVDTTSTGPSVPTSLTVSCQGYNSGSFDSRSLKGWSSDGLGGKTVTVTVALPMISGSCTSKVFAKDGTQLASEAYSF